MSETTPIEEPKKPDQGKPKKPKKRNYSVKDIAEWKFNKLSMPPEWVAHLGNLTENFRMLVEGPSGHGKTEYIFQLTKMLSNHYGKVTLNNVEQGKSSTIKEAFIRNKMDDIKGGKWMLCDPTQRTFEEWFKRLESTGSGRVVVLDSLDYMKLTLEQFKRMHERFKRKSIIIVCWNDPMDGNAKKIKYMCDIKVEVENFRAKIRSRFGGNHVWDIYPDRPKKTDTANAQQFSEPKKKELIRMEKYHDTKVLIYEDQPEQLTRETAKALFLKYPDATEIHELHEVWGGRWSRKEALKEEPSHAPEGN